MDISHGIILILHIYRSVDAVARVEFREIFFGADGVIHGHRAHPAFDRFVFDGGSLAGRIGLEDFAFDPVLVKRSRRRFGAGASPEQQG